MKKFLFCLITVVTLISFCLPASADDGKVEISFCVGDDTLIINGNPVKVEKPYVVEDKGVTLVPVRVITEAFDAKVDWVDETQTVILTYPDVNIIIQIGNPIAEVNGRAEELLTPPELTESGYTMVPLRFISENFGADVFWDEATERITVVKEKPDNSDVSIEGTVSSKYIGDSYYGWRMENPLDMQMESRDFDGFETVFSDGVNKIDIDVYVYDEEFDFETDYNESKRALSDLTLVKDEKDTSNKECLSYHLAAKDKNKYLDYIQYVTPDYIYAVMGVFSNEDVSVRDKYLNLVMTFECKYEETDTHDLSNTKDGFKRFESEAMKLSFDVPETFCMTSSEDSHNSFEFAEVEKGVSSMSVVVYSKGNIGSAKALATEDYDHNKSVLNKAFATFSDGITSRQYTDFTAYEYTYTLESEKKSYTTRDVFFEVGDYIYNIRVDVELPHENYDEYIDRIIESIKTEPLDSEEVGILMRNIPIATGSITGKIGKATVEIPNIYVKVLSDENSMIYTSPVTGVALTFLKTQSSGTTIGELRETMKTIERQMENDGATVIRTTYGKTIDNRNFIALVVSQDGNILEQYACIYNDTAYIISVACSELMYSDDTQKEIRDIVDSIKIR